MNFIIYEDEKEYAARYKNAICKLLGPMTINYKIIEISEYTEKNKKITFYHKNKKMKLLMLISLMYRELY